MLTDDLTPHTYNKAAPTTAPSSWSPLNLLLRTVAPADLEAQLRALCKPDAEMRPDGFPTKEATQPEPATRALMAHAAWQKGFTKYCEPVITGDLVHQKEGPEKYVAAVMEDLAWRHFLRGVNLLMFADRKEVLPHLRLALQLSPNGEHAKDAKDLLHRLEKMVTEDASPPIAPRNPLEMPEPARAQYFVSQLRDLRCQQWAQPGDIALYGVASVPDKSLPTSQLLEMGMAAVPTLIASLEDDTPTRTVYHWRDFDKHRVVWRISDFAYAILCDITKKQLGQRSQVGFTLSYLDPPERQAVIAEVNEWYVKNKHLSVDEQMLGFFAGGSTEEWATAGEYFLERGDKRAVAPLAERIPMAGKFDQGELCILLAEFGDPATKDVIKKVMDSAQEPSDRMNAAIALDKLGDASAIPVAIEFVKLEEPPYGNWDEPVWLLLHCKTKDAIDALMYVVTEGSPRRVIEVLESITSAAFGSLWSRTSTPVGCVEVCPVLLAAMDRADLDENGRRVKDEAAVSFAALTGHTQDSSSRIKYGRFVRVDPAVFDQESSDVTLRDRQIEALKSWYEMNKHDLFWDPERQEICCR
ncbi:MAG: hypothetical protein IT364_11180 [Candidatus Hydrogenedentes bacterium]|nr:hypothetical protein [Candidatus Hydrogenedentota bacterium]